MTRDQVIISKFEFWVFHKVDPGPVHIQRGNGRYPFTDDIVLLTWSSSGMDWSGGIRGIAETSARDVIGRHTAEEMAVISGSLRDRLKTELLEQINKITAPFLGVQVIATDIGAVEFPEEVEIALLDKWVAEVERIVTMTRAEAEKDALSRKGEGEALALGRVEQVKTAIREQMIRQIIEPIRQQTGQAITSEQIAVRYIEAIEKLSKNLVADDLTALRYVEALEKIVSSEGSKTIILGEEKGFWTPTTG
jgi:regulator of protease activity HflC (stomatin/prohibitin superfamily)